MRLFYYFSIDFPDDDGLQPGEGRFVLGVNFFGDGRNTLLQFRKVQQRDAALARLRRAAPLKEQSE